MQVQENDPISLEELHSSGAESIESTRTIGIIRSCFAIISLVSSSILIWILKKSNARFSSTYHRILLGMSAGDILFSLSATFFNSSAPSDSDYYVWNAKGNQATCTAQGFMITLGVTISIHYSCSLNLYSLAVVKCNKTDSYIRTKIEPFLHGVPIGWALIYATTLLVNRNFNDGGNGGCYATKYTPPHCIGYADGEIREGFVIPCGRGRDGAALLHYCTVLVTFFAVPFVIGVSLWMIYRAVKRQEQVNSRYGAGSFTINTARQASSGANSGENEGSSHRQSSIRSTVSSISRRWSSVQSSPTSNSRIVLRRVFAFTISFLLTWSFFFIGICFDIANKDIPFVIVCLTVIFNPLQGFFNLCIFLQPKVSKIKSKGGNGMTWCQAVMEAIWYTGRGHQAPGRGRRPSLVALQPGEGKTDSQLNSQTLEAKEEARQAPGLDVPHDTHVPFDGSIGQIDTVES